MAGTILLLSDFPSNTLTHLCTNEFLFAHIANVNNQKLYICIHIRDIQNDMKTYKYVV